MVALLNVQSVISALLFTVIALPLAGDMPRAPRRGAALSIALARPEAAELKELRRQGNIAFKAGDYLKAVETYESGYQEAIRRRELRSALRFLNNLGSANYQLLRFRDAIRAYLQARELAITQGDQETLGAIYLNLSSLYDQMGEIDAATESAERGLELPVAATLSFRSRLLIQSALIQLHQRNCDRATLELREAVDLASSRKEVAVEAQAWNELGETLMECGQLPTARPALLEGLRLRESGADERLHFSYESLGRLSLLENDRAGAIAFFDKAIESAAALGPLALWRPLYGRGKAHLADSNLQAAYADFAAAIEHLKSWRAEVPPADAFRVSSEVEQNEVYSAFIELAIRLYRETAEPRYAAESLAAAEDSRAASLRTLWLESGRTKELPSAYWTTLTALQDAESGQSAKAADRTTIRSLRLKLMEMETGAALDLPRPLADADPTGRKFLQRARRALGQGEVFLGFHTGDSGSCLWAISRDTFEFRALPPKAELARDVHTFVRSLNENPGKAAVMGRQIYHRLFGNLSTGSLRQPTWIVAPDGPLFDLPFVALTGTSPSKQEYVIERHAIRMVPGFSALIRSPHPEPDEVFVGVGDAVYNRADARWPRAQQPLLRGAGIASPGGSANRILELPRLPGSAREIGKCAGIWRANGRRVLILEGEDANKHNLAKALQSNPSVLHVAAHILFPTQQARQGMVALGLQPDQKVELLSATEIASMRAKLGLVVLDGCSSGQGPVLPGTGLMGLTRAWLVAGARAVIATRWPVADHDTGELFSSLYRLYFSRRSDRPVSFGRLLREAQLNDLHAGGPHADPAYWATYFCVETN